MICGCEEARLVARLAAMGPADDVIQAINKELAFRLHQQCTDVMIRHSIPRVIAVGQPEFSGILLSPLELEAIQLCTPQFVMPATQESLTRLFPRIWEQLESFFVELASQQQAKPIGLSICAPPRVYLTRALGNMECFLRMDVLQLPRTAGTVPSPKPWMSG